MKPKPKMTGHLVEAILLLLLHQLTRALIYKRGSKSVFNDLIPNVSAPFGILSLSIFHLDNQSESWQWRKRTRSTREPIRRNSSRCLHRSSAASGSPSICLDQPISLCLLNPFHTVKLRGPYRTRSVLRWLTQTCPTLQTKTPTIKYQRVPPRRR